MQETKSLNKEIITLSTPAVLQAIVRSSIPIIDSFWIGKLGSEHLAAITVGGFLSWGLFALGATIPIGTNALVAQARGASEKDTSELIAATNLIISLIWGFLISITIFPMLPFLYELSHLDETKSLLADAYLFPLLAGFSAIILFETGNSIFRGNSDTKTPFKLLLIAIVLKLFLTPLLIFGTGQKMIMGMSGAPVATVISYSFSFIIGLIILKKRKLISTFSLVLKFFRNKAYELLKILKTTIKIGFPLALEGVTFVAIYVFVSRYVADFGTVGLAALGIGHRAEAIPYQVGEGFSVTASILVGQNIGALNPNRAEKSAWRILWISCVPMFLYSLLLFIFPAEISAIFTSDKDVIEAAKAYNIIASFCIFFAMTESIFTGAFAGAGNSLPPLIISLPITAMRIPLCAIFTPLYELNGIWIAIFSTMVLKGIIIALWFKKGNWKKRKFELAHPPTAETNPLEYIDLR